MQNIEFGFRKFKHNLKDIDIVILSYKKCITPSRSFKTLTSSTILKLILCLKFKYSHETHALFN